MTFRFGPARIWIRELAWLLISWAFSWAFAGQLFGYNYLWRPELDIQLHNNYFVLQPLLLTTLLFLPIATVVTGVRVLVGAIRHCGPNSIQMLASIWVLLGVLAAVLWLLRWLKYLS